MGAFPLIDRFVWGWTWGGWAWLTGIAVVIFVGLFILPWFFFLLNLQGLLGRIDPYNRAMSPGYVWLNFIPVFNLGWFLYTVVKIKDSVENEYRSRGWYDTRDRAYNLGLATGILAVVNVVLGWLPVIGWASGVAQLVCWILYWLRTNEIKNQLASPALSGSGVYATPSSRVGGWSAAGPGTGYPGRGPGGAASAGLAGPGPAGFWPVVATGGRPAAGGPATGATVSSAVRICAVCGTAYAETDRYCKTCGTRLPEAKQPQSGAGDEAGADREGTA